MPRRRPGDYPCPHCGELVDTYPDPGGGESQTYVEDCPVCCRPNVIHAVRDPESGEVEISAQAE